MLLQIVHVNGCHWATIQTVEEGEVLVFDSAYGSVNMHTVDLISKLVCCTKSSITIKMMNLSKQTGSTDCALFSMAMATSIAMGSNPVNVVYDQEALRPHLLKIFETGDLSSFPVHKQRRMHGEVKNSKNIDIYCFCRMRDDGTRMVCCDRCEEWYHERCITNRATSPFPTVDFNDKWFCDKCV